MVGDELLQFADVDPLGAGRFRLTRLVRGCGGTESALDDHAVGDLFLLINPASMQPITCLIGDRESVVTVTQPATGARATTAGRSHKLGAGRRPSTVTAAPGGTTIDSEARQVIAQILTALRQHRLIDT